MKIEPRCDHCEHWNTEDGMKEVAGGLGVCTRIPELWDATEWVKDAEEEPTDYIARLPTAEHAETLAFVQDGSDYKADLFTKGAFYCAHFTATAGE